MEGEAESQRGGVTCLRGHLSRDRAGIEPAQVSRHPDALSPVPHPRFGSVGRGAGGRREAGLRLLLQAPTDS